MANFFWNAQGEKRAHWIKWTSICTPIDEGGLGIETFDHIRSGLHAKSLWAYYARSKYFRASAPHNISQASPLWKLIVSHFQVLGSHSRWIIGAGGIRFWKDNWTGEILEGPQPCDETLTVAQGLECLEELWKFIPAHLRALIPQIQVDSTQPDRLVFTATDLGKFSTKVFKSIIRHQGVQHRWPKSIRQ